MDSIAVIRNFMVENGLCYLLVNSTNEFLVEYNTLEENSRYKLTGFSGSTGEALVTPDKIYLFVDGRYHIQADNEVDHEKVTVVKLQTGQKYLDELVNFSFYDLPVMRKKFVKYESFKRVFISSNFEITSL